MYSPLPLGTHPRALSFPHFPALHQAVIFRNWGIVPGKTIAQVLCAAESQIHHAAAEMGLPCDVGNSEIWLRRGYLTVIRNNWHLLPYDQLLALLGWNTDRLNAVLQEEDFLWHKLGYLKPDCPKVFFRELKEEEKIQTAEISRILHEYFPDQDTASDEKPFSFIDALSAPYTSLKTHTDTTQCRFEWRLIHSYFGCTGDVLHNLKENDPYPEGLLARYAELGVNAVWLHAVLYRLYPWKPAGDLSKDYQSRFDNLNTLIERAQRHGISLFLYLNEPRALPADCFDAHPTLRGVNSVDGLTSALCTSQPENLQFLHEASAWVFRQSPGLAGVFTISMSENLTHCHSRGRGAECPRCAQRPVSTVIAEVNNTIAAGIRSIKKNAEIFVWNWGWRTVYPDQKSLPADTIHGLQPDIVLCATSEEALPVHKSGINTDVIDYSISQVGPSAYSRHIWQTAKNRNMSVMAKVQFNNTWECSAVPYIPVPFLIQEHKDNLLAADVDNILLSWTLGGYPSANLELLIKSPDEYLQSHFGTASGSIGNSLKQLGRAFTEFPFHVSVLYVGPQNFGPANLLFAAKTGYAATMIGFPYDDVTGWRACYPPDVFETQYEKLCVQWKQGLDTLTEIGNNIHKDYIDSYSELHRVAETCYLHFRSAYLQIMFNRLRSEKEKNIKELLLLLDEESALAARLWHLCRKDSRLGFEASNHYYYTLNNLMEKVLNCRYLRNSIKK